MVIAIDPDGNNRTRTVVDIGARAERAGNLRTGSTSLIGSTCS